MRGLGRQAASVIAAIPDAALAGLFLITWIAPTLVEERMVRYLLLLILLEFIVIHSAAFMGVAATSVERGPRRILAIVGLGLFYSIFAGAFSVAFSDPWPLVAFWGLTLNRLLRALLTARFTEEEQTEMSREWGVSVMAYVGFIFLTVLLPLPRLGLTAEFISTQNLPGGGLWIEQPQRAIAFGMLYFGAMTMYAIRSSRSS